MDYSTGDFLFCLLNDKTKFYLLFDTEMLNEIHYHQRFSLVIEMSLTSIWWITSYSFKRNSKFFHNLIMKWFQICFGLLIAIKPMIAVHIWTYTSWYNKSISFVVNFYLFSQDFRWNNAHVLFYSIVYPAELTGINVLSHINNEVAIIFSWVLYAQT